MSVPFSHSGEQEFSVIVKDLLLSDIVEAVAAASKHCFLELLVENPYDVLDALLAFAGESPEDASADPNEVSAESESLQHIRSVSNATVEPDGDLLDTLLLASSLNLVAHFLKDLDRGRRGIELSRSVVADVDPVNTVHDGQSGIISAHHALGEDWQARRLLDVGNDIPANLVVLVRLDELGEARALLRLDVRLRPLVNVLREVLHLQRVRQLESVSGIIQPLSEELRVAGQSEGAEA